MKRVPLAGVARFLILFFFVFYLGYFFGVKQVKIAWKNFKPVVSIVSKKPPTSNSLDMNLFYQVLEKVGADYYDKSKIDTKKILYGAISGMLESLGDPYTSFFPPKETSSFKTSLSGEFSGIGAELGMTDDNKITVISPLDNSPAQKAGVRSGDMILKVDGKDTSGWTLSQAVEKIRGPKGTEVVLTIERPPADRQDVIIKRDTIVIKSVTADIKSVNCLDGLCKEDNNCSSCQQIAYIRLSQFGDKTNSEWTNAVSDVLTKTGDKNNFEGVVLDLRNNPGGYLQDAVFIASEFLDNGVVVVQEDSTGEKKQMEVSRRGTLLDVPLVVLINKGSASASEIVAAALKDNKRAKLVGENTFGKGTIQEAVDVDSGASVHISVAKWLTPSGEWVDKVGIKPDIAVETQATRGAKIEEDKQLEKAILELFKN